MFACVLFFSTYSAWLACFVWCGVLLCHIQDYTEELREIAKAKLKDTLPASSITLINQRPVSEDLHVNCFFYLFFHEPKTVELFNKQRLDC